MNYASIQLQTRRKQSLYISPFHSFTHTEFDFRSSCCDANADCTCSTISGHYSCVCKPGYYGSGFLDSCQRKISLFTFSQLVLTFSRFFFFFSVCPNSTYWHTWNLCKPCQDVNHIIINTPATNSSFCVCKAGFRANEHNRCEILQCPLLQPPENGYFVKHPNGCSNVLNAACGARCKSGYQLTGSSIRLCQEDGKWSGNEAKCVCMKSLDLSTTCWIF